MNFGWNRVRERAAAFWLGVLFWCTRHMPWVIQRCKPFAIWAAWLSSPHIRRTTTANARWLLGETSSSRECRVFGRKVLRRFFDAVVEFGTNRGLSKAELLARVDKIVGQDRFEEARQRRRGAILVTAHIGSFETAMASLAEREPRLHVVFRRDENHVFESLRLEQHARLGILEARAEEGLAMWLRVREALRADEVVLVQGDRLSPGEAGVTVPFLGGHIRVPAGPAKLARATGSPLIPTFAVVSESGRVQIHLEEPIWTEELEVASGTPDPAVVRFAAALESCVRRYPDQWLLLHKVWCEDLRSE
ncbi:MAG: lysophospholipid acyltransferase family protein [Phycisphaerales bacterium]